MVYSVILATGLVSLLSIPNVIYPTLLSNFRTYFCICYLIIDCFRIKNKNFEDNLLYYLHHISSLYLIFYRKDCNVLINNMFFLEFSSFLYHLTKYFNFGKLISKFYWIYDRIYRFPLLITKYSYCISKHIFAFYVLQYVGYVWTMQVIKQTTYKYYWSALLMILSIYHNNTISLYI